MLYNSLLFNKIESSIGVDKWVKELDIQEKPFMKPLYKVMKIVFFISTKVTSIIIHNFPLK
jgi:hypothetical protein